MFDIKWIRDNAGAFDAGLKKRGLEPLSKTLLELDEARRRHLTNLQEAQSRRNAASKEIGKAKAAVFPVPVCAFPVRSFPFRVIGRDFSCIGVQYLNLFS